jgi:hypothetical protein
MGIFKVFYNWIENLEGKHIIYMAIVCTSLLIVGYIGQGSIIPSMNAGGEALIILTNIHMIIIWSGWIALALCLISLFLFFQIS